MDVKAIGNIVVEFWIRRRSSVEVNFAIYPAHVAFLRYYEDLYIEDTLLFMVLPSILARCVEVEHFYSNKLLREYGRTLYLSWSHFYGVYCFFILIPTPGHAFRDRRAP
jgi:hypothetical protein